MCVNWADTSTEKEIFPFLVLRLCLHCCVARVTWDKETEKKSQLVSGNLQRPPYWIPTMQCEQNIKALRLHLSPCNFLLFYFCYLNHSEILKKLCFLDICTLFQNISYFIEFSGVEVPKLCKICRILRFKANISHRKSCKCVISRMKNLKNLTFASSMSVQTVPLILAWKLKPRTQK